MILKFELTASCRLSPGIHRTRDTCDPEEGHRSDDDRSSAASAPESYIINSVISCNGLWPQLASESSEGHVCLKFKVFSVFWGRGI